MSHDYCSICPSIVICAFYSLLRLITDAFPDQLCLCSWEWKECNDSYPQADDEDRRGFYSI